MINRSIPSAIIFSEFRIGNNLTPGPSPQVERGAEKKLYC